MAFGVRPELVRARRARMTYGIRYNVPYEDGAPGKFWNEVRGLVRSQHPTCAMRYAPCVSLVHPLPGML